MLMLLKSIHGPINSYHSFCWSNLILCLYNVDLLNICMKEFDFPNRAFVYALMVPSWADQLLSQLLMEPFDTLPIQCRHIEQLHEGVWFRKNNFGQNDSCENLDNFPLIGHLIYALMVPSWADQLLS